MRRTTAKAVSDLLVRRKQLVDVLTNIYACDFYEQMDFQLDAVNRAVRDIDVRLDEIYKDEVGGL